jgi:hypothetical protein
MQRAIIPAGLILVSLATTAVAQQTTSLFDTKLKAFGWTFGNGPEFPGAIGELAVDEAVKHEGRSTLRLEADFSKGGGYVQAGRTISDELDIRELAVWIKDPDAEALKFRIVDDAGQVHQLRPRLLPIATGPPLACAVAEREVGGGEPLGRIRHSRDSRDPAEQRRQRDVAGGRRPEWQRTPSADNMGVCRVERIPRCPTGEWWSNALAQERAGLSEQRRASRGVSIVVSFSTGLRVADSLKSEDRA